jgi:chromosome partitioning protein
VLNQTPPRSYRVRDAAEGLAVLGVVPDVNIVLRNDYQDAIGLGKGVTEFNPQGQAADEIRRLWAWVDKRVRAPAAADKRAAATSAKRPRVSKDAQAA